MAKKQATKKGKLVKSPFQKQPGWEFYVTEPDKKDVQAAAAEAAAAETQDCCGPCTKTITLLSATKISPSTGVGGAMTNIDGYRWINAYVISDAISSTANRGFTLELSFSLYPFVLGVGVVGESSYSFNFDNYYDSSTSTHRLICCRTSDLTAPGGSLPHYGGVDLAHILRAPVLGPYVRASVSNQDSVSRTARVEAYLST